MKTAQEMYQFCIEKEFGHGLSEKWTLKHLELIEQNLSTDENVLMCFIGLHNFISPTKHGGNFAYAVTEKQIIMAQKKLIGEESQAIFIDHINDILFNTGVAFSVITIDTAKGKFDIAIRRKYGVKINSKLHDMLYSLKQKASKYSISDPVVEIQKYKTS